jgi:hypothetical protein
MEENKEKEERKNRLSNGEGNNNVELSGHIARFAAHSG